MITGLSVWFLFGVVLINTIFVAALAVALFIINQKVNEALSKVDPLLEKATETMGKVEETTAQLQQKVEHALEKTTQLVDQVSERVDTTTAIAEEAVTEPLIGAASLMAGINRGLQVYAERSSAKGENGDARL